MAAHTMTHLYNGFVDRVTEAWNSALAKIGVEYNFDLGPEFEMAICQTIRLVLPQRFGICRGFVVNQTGETAGDDIVIYERMSFPTARFLGENLAIKEQVPIEAAVAYIEAKHTIDIEGDINSGSSLVRALSQAAKVKALCEKRRPYPTTTFDRYFNVGDPMTVSTPKEWPSRRDPFYTAVISRHVRLKSGESHETDPWKIIDKAIATPVPPTTANLVILGQSVLGMPRVVLEDGRETVNFPFSDLANPTQALFKVDDIAFGAGLCHLLWALDYVTLNAMPWGDVLGDAVNSKPAV